MPWTLRNTATAGNSSGAGLSVPMPTGITLGDLTLIAGYLEPDTNGWATGPSGYTLAQSGVNTGAFGLSLWWKIAGASEAAQTITPTTSNWRTAISACWSGGSGSGSFIDVVGSVGQGDSVLVSAQDGPSITTLTANDLLVWVYGNFSGTNVASITGAANTLAVSFGGLTIGYANLGAAGVTGTTEPNTGPGSDTFAAFHVGFLLTGAGGGGGGVISDARQPRGLERGYGRGYV